MLVKNVGGEATGASMVKNSEFYIELAKFVQAYSIIINNPNEFLSEVNEPAINEKKDRISWAQLVKIMTRCDFGYAKIPTEIDLKVFYNYALEMGSLDSANKNIATVKDVADAQKHYYNFIDKAKDKAETEYLKQHKVYLSRENEMRNADNELSKLKSGKAFSYVMMMFSAFIGIFGIFSFFVSNVVANSIGQIIPVWKANFVGGIVLILISLLLFFLFDKMFNKFSRKHFKLKQATETIFMRGNDSYAREIELKRKLEELTRELKIVQSELNDKHKRYDVQTNINRLKTTNKYYQKFVSQEDEMQEQTSRQADDERNMRAEDFAPVTLTREQEENLRRVGKEAITLQGQYDLDAYKEKFEKSRSNKENEKEQNENQEKNDKAFEVDDAKQAELAEQQRQEQLKAQEKELLESIDYIKEILGFSGEEEIEKGK